MPWPALRRGPPSSSRREKARKLFSTCPSPPCACPKLWWRICRVLGFERIGELAAKPRAPLALRFGPELGRRLDQAMGRFSEPIDPVRPPDLIEVRRVFAEPIGAPETIARYTGKLVGQLCEALEAKGLGARQSRSALSPGRQPHRGHPHRHGAAGARCEASDPAPLRQDRDHRSGLRHRDHAPGRHRSPSRWRRNR